MVYDSARKYKMIKDFEEKRQRRREEAERRESVQGDDYDWRKDYRI